MKLTIVRGIPGSGKTWWAEQLAHDTGALLLEGDRLRMRDGRYVYKPEEVYNINGVTNAMLKSVAKYNADVIVTGTFLYARTVHWIVSLAQNFCPYHVKVRVVRMTGRFQNKHGIRDDIVEGMASAIEDYPGEELTAPTDYDDDVE